jgi:TetR/AcrR family transcriptional regulator, cholesterol catabolism regulator
MKEEILKTSLKQFLKHGIREMSIQKLVEPLGISTKTVYKYFRNKEELLEEALHLYHGQQYEVLENISTEQNAATVFFDLWNRALEIEYKVNKAFFHDLHYYYPEMGKKVEAAIAKKFREQFLGIIQRGMEEGSFRRDIIPEVVLEGIFVLYTAIVRAQHFKGFRISQYEVLLNTIGNFIRGFCTEKGVEELNEHIQNFQIEKGLVVTG